MSNPNPQASPTPGWTPVDDRSRPVLAVEVVGIALGLVGFVAMMAYFLRVTDLGNTAVASMLAMVPLAIVVAAVLWIDRWEREPVRALLFAFLWGAGVSVVISLILNTQIGEMLASGMGEFDALVMEVAVVAPIVEEFAKGLGVLIIFLALPKYFDGVVDGIVYSALVAAGFAFTENILYFIQFADQIGETFVGRGLMGPFAHVSFTFMMGIALGVAARQQNRLAWVWMLPIGYVLSVLMHALWNYSTFSMYYDTLYWAL